MTGLLHGPVFTQAMRAARRARRLETRLAYTLSPAEQDQEPIFRSGDYTLSTTYAAWWDAWRQQVQPAVDEGGGYDRVRVVADPPTDYQRFALWSAQFNARAGEQVNYMSRAAATAAGVPDADFWILDGATVLLMHYTLDNLFLGAIAVTAPDAVARYTQWHDIAIAISQPYDEYLAADPSRGRPAVP
ncbi:MAG: hypothetical protein H7Y15_02405 [Pseudonocardia sp.]|nr:hypothetical protein [Pseudonocardia sp.]